MNTTSFPLVRKMAIDVRAIDLAIILAVTFACRIWWFHSPVLDYDEQLYSYIGQQMLAGKLPYVDIWDRKPIGLFLIFAASHALLGASIAAYLFVAALFSAGGAWIVYRIAGDFAGRETGLVAGLLYTIGMFAFGCMGAQAEVFMTVPCLAMARLLLTRADSRGAMALAMLLGGLAIQIKTSAAPFCVVFGLLVLWTRWRLLRDPVALAGEVLLYGILGLLPTVAVAAFYAMVGHFDAFFYANFLSVFERPAVIGRWHPMTLIIMSTVFLTALVGIWAFLRTGRSYDGGRYAVFMALAVGALASIYATANVLVHYYAFLVPWAVLLATPFYDMRVPIGRLCAGWLLAGYLLAANHPKRLAETHAGEIVFNRFVGEITSEGPGQGLYVFAGAFGFYPATGNDGGRYPYPSHHSNALERAGLGISQEALAKQALARKPKFIISLKLYEASRGRGSVGLVREALRSHYRPIDQGTVMGDDLVLYRRR